MVHMILNLVRLKDCCCSTVYKIFRDTIVIDTSLMMKMNNVHDRVSLDKLRAWIIKLYCMLLAYAYAQQKAKPHMKPITDAKNGEAIQPFDFKALLPGVWHYSSFPTLRQDSSICGIIKFANSSRLKLNRMSSSSASFLD